MFQVRRRPIAKRYELCPCVLYELFPFSFNRVKLAKKELFFPDHIADDKWQYAVTFGLACCRKASPPGCRWMYSAEARTTFAYPRTNAVRSDRISKYSEMNIEIGGRLLMFAPPAATLFFVYFQVLK